MSIVVQKYGGSSVADADRIRGVAERVMRTKQAGHDVVVVVSAMGHTTDELLALARKISPAPDRREPPSLKSPLFPSVVRTVLYSPGISCAIARTPCRPTCISRRGASRITTRPSS